VIIPLLLLSTEAAEGGLPGPFNPTPALAVWTVVVFAVVLFILAKQLFPVIVRATADREETIRLQLAEAKQMHADAQAALEEQRKLLAGSRGEATAMLAEARQAAERERTLAVEKTRAEQDEMLARARREIEAEKGRAVAELRREAVDLAIAAAGKVVGQSLDSAADRKLVEEYLATVGKTS
jgi:F-type H+-transporting ATPase subunit b